MKMNPEQIERTQQQMKAEAIPAQHPLVSQLERIFGEHTYFLDGRGLNIVEPVDPSDQDAPLGVVVNLATWTDSTGAGLRPHEPEPTEQLIDLDTEESGEVRH